MEWEMLQKKVADNTKHVFYVKYFFSPEFVLFMR